MGGKNSPELSRRKLTKLGAGIVFGAGSATVGTASTSTSERTAEDAGISKEVRRLLVEGNHAKAEDLLSKHGVAHDRDAVSAGVRITSDGEKVNQDQSTVQPQDVWGESRTSLDLTGVMISENLASIGYSIDLDPPRDGVGSECAPPEDGIAVSWSGDYWEYDPGSMVLGEHMSGTDPNPEGVIVDFDDGAERNDDAYDKDKVSLFFDVQKTEPGTFNIYGHYAHSWTPYCVPGGVSFSIGLASFSVDVSGGTDYWKKPSPTIQI